MPCARTQCFLLLIFSLVVPLTVTAQPQNPTEPKNVKRQLYAAVSAGDAQKFASLIDNVRPKDRAEFLLYTEQIRITNIRLIMHTRRLREPY
jgi:hypothetical protein